jgi:hypothetical protein
MFNGFVGGAARFYTKTANPVEFRYEAPKGFIRTASESKKGASLTGAAKRCRQTEHSLSALGGLKVFQKLGQFSKTVKYLLGETTLGQPL